MIYGSVNDDNQSSKRTTILVGGMQVTTNRTSTFQVTAFDSKGKLVLWYGSHGNNIVHKIVLKLSAHKCCLAYYRPRILPKRTDGIVISTPNDSDETVTTDDGECERVHTIQDVNTTSSTILSGAVSSNIMTRNAQVRGQIDHLDDNIGKFGPELNTFLGAGSNPVLVKDPLSE